MGETAIREVREEIGLDLSEFSNWECLGYINDRFALELKVRCYVFLQLIEKTPALNIQESEVSACGWCSVHHLCLPSYEVQTISGWPLSRFYNSKLINLTTKFRIPQILGLHNVCFNGLDL